MKTSLIYTLILLFLFLIGGCVKMNKIKTADGGTIYTNKTQEEYDRSVEQNKAQQAAKKKMRADVLGSTNVKMRGPNDPIKVALVEITLSKSLEKNPGPRLFQYYRDAIKKDPVIKLVKQKKVKEAEEEHGSVHRRFGRNSNEPVSYGADAVVRTKAIGTKEVGLNKKTNKLAGYMKLEMTAEIEDRYTGNVYTVTESDNIFQNERLLKKFSEKVNYIIKTEIGPNVPKSKFHKNLMRMGN